MATEEFDIRKHLLVPEHIKLKEEEANKILEVLLLERLLQLHQLFFVNLFLQIY
ncbi:hypothetical protein J4438_03645 [Candidatus Woesearchaeota archaeon]|nr:hypothetical protein [Candidatus Woesearchaeota archaeon]